MIDQLKRHIHLGYSGEQPGVDLVIERLQQELDLPTSIKTILRTIDGPQAKSLPEVSALHTPTLDATKDRKFTTTRFGVDDQEVLAQIVIPTLRAKKTEGVVVEVEIPFMFCDANGQWTENQPALSRDVEVHHRIHNVDGNGDPLTLEKLAEDSNTLGIAMGGWAEFMRPDGTRTFNSNHFFPAGKNPRGEILTQHDSLVNYLGPSFQVTTLAETLVRVFKT